MVVAAAGADNLITQDLVTDGNATATRLGGGNAEVYVAQTGGTCDANGDRINVTSNQAWLTIASPGYVNVTGCGTGNAQSLGYSVTAAAPLAGVALVTGSEHVNDPEIGTSGGNNDFTVTVVPRAPASLTATATTTPSVSVAWPTSLDETAADFSYLLERKAGAGAYAALTTVNATGSATYNHSDTAVTAGTAYCYRVRARYNAGGGTNVTSGFTSEQCATPTAAPADTTPPVISYVLTPGSPDGNDDWYKSNVALVWTVTEAESPGSLVKTGCVNQNITTDQAATTYSCSATSTGGSASAVSVTIKRDATAPTAETTLYAAANGSNGWYTIAPAWTTAGSDTLSGLASSTCETGTYSGGEGTGLTVSGTCTDNAGNTASDASPPFKYDATGPSATLAVTAGTEGSNGWYTSDVTVSTSGSDTVSNPTTCSADQSQSTETTGQALNGSCMNAAGLTTLATSLTVKLDKSAPGVVYTSQSPSANAAGWNKTDVVATFTATDTISGFAGPSTTKTGTSTSSGEGAAVSVDSPAFVDLAGNTAAAGAAKKSFKIDMTAPTLTWAGGPAAGSSHYFGFLPAAPTCTTVDPLYSGPAGCTVADYSPAVGPHEMIATALDVAGNSYIEKRTYTVLAWTLNGFYQPVDMNNVLNTVKNGSTVPLKFEVFAGSTELTDPAAVKTLASVQITCNASAPVDEVEMVATGGTSLRYDSTGGQFIYNWKTPSTAGNCYRVTMTTQDDSSLVAFFKLK